MPCPPPPLLRPTAYPRPPSTRRWPRRCSGTRAALRAPCTIAQVQAALARCAPGPPASLTSAREGGGGRHGHRGAAGCVFAAPFGGGAGGGGLCARAAAAGGPAGRAGAPGAERAGPPHPAPRPP
eukprot:1804548-Rhodomonas_salina.3